MDDTLVQDLIEINEVEEDCEFAEDDAIEYAIEQSRVETVPKPYVGMEFESPDDAQQYYNKYARSKGFGTRKNRIFRSRTNKIMIAREFVCSKEGLRAKKYLKKEDRVHAAPDEIREGCKAMILISKKEEKWIISRYRDEHNHVLASPKSTQFIRSHRVKTKVQKDLMDVLDESGIRPSKIVSVLSHECGGLEKIYSIREKWVPAFLRNTFCAGMSTTQRSESLNKFFKDYVNANTSVSKFVLKFEEALDDRYNKEREKNFKTINSKPILKTLYPMEAEASCIYTRKLFRMFQDELIHAQKYVADRAGVTDGVKVYKVHEFSREKPTYTVTFNISLNDVVCNCHKFEYMGILCRHVLAIFIKKKVLSLPSQYILCRWTKDAKKNDNLDIIQNEIADKVYESSTLWFNSIMLHSLRLSEKASRSKKHYGLAVSSIKSLCDELDNLTIDLVDEGKKSTYGDDSKMVGNGVVLYNDITLKDPIHVITKGRPPSLRKKSSVEKNNKKSKTCSSCNRKGHTKRTCERRQPPK
ncbi:hypothetical protein V6N11_062023 [Hibiscus sabdariffa]|uniref:Protein FAR1-RELATED SEQUENCE n=1 Tax=Hibiscus sabdariffa TaxID=183260 RepID=A0ABR2PRD2_9ROSI